MATGKDPDHGRRVFPLTTLQIGDLQSYLSHLSLFLPPDSGKFFILVDNRPWLQDLVSRSTHLWQLMVTKSRLSPFANTRRKKDPQYQLEELSELQASSAAPDANELGIIKRWFSLIDAAMLSKKRAVLPVKKLRNSLIANSELHRTLYGFIVFEVTWKNVRGINYFNELQTDTSLAIEAKVMRRWEFDSISQAARSLGSWFPGTLHEQILLKKHLDAMLGEVFHDAQESFRRAKAINADGYIDDDTRREDESPCSATNCFRVFPTRMENRTNRFLTPPPVRGPNKRRKITRSLCFDNDIGYFPEEDDTQTVEILSQSSDGSDSEDTLEPTLYKDVLILFRFNDRDLPFTLKDIIMSDLRLLTLLEAGLPSWVLFLQSYPVFCHIYRPWMCPLARTLYVVVSIITVLIGFYDLYKNVPLLKATASGLFGPFFDWIETLEMISRIKYLGTMLFLHNFQKALKWFLTVTRTARSALSFIIVPLSGPLTDLVELFVPLWTVLLEVTASFLSVFWTLFESTFTLIGDLIEILFLPLWYALVVLWNIATSVIYPLLWILWEILYAPFRLVLGLCGFVSFLCRFVYDIGGDLWLLLSGILNITREVESTVGSHEISMWRALWNDLFSHIFRALRSILNGFVAFFAACNRHRLSIYNHMKELLRRLSHATSRRGQAAEHNSQSVQMNVTHTSPLTPRAVCKESPRQMKQAKSI